MKLGDILDTELLKSAVADGYVRIQRHPTLPLVIYNYTEKAQYEGAWNEATLTCRGLIVSAITGDVVARPFRKFFNYGQVGAPQLDLNAPAVVTDKMDGSLGIAYDTPDGPAIATRGSFSSDQAVHATRVLRTRYPDWRSPRSYTVLFEIIYPANRIVLDYGAQDDLVLLGAVDIETGQVVGPEQFAHWLSLLGKCYAYAWTGPVVERLSYSTLTDALAAPPRPNAEGLVVHLPYGNLMVKIKQDDYVALHRVLTGTSARTAWEYLAVNACRDLIRQPKHWGTYLGVDGDRAAQILAVGDGWFDRLVASVPDEFFLWLRATVTDIEESFTDLFVRLHDEYGELNLRHFGDRRGFVEAVATHPHRGALLLLLDGRSIVTYVWKYIYPPPSRPWTTTRDEDVA